MIIKKPADSKDGRTQGFQGTLPVDMKRRNKKIKLKTKQKIAIGWNFNSL